MRDSNPHSQQATGRRITPLTARPLGSAYNCRCYSQTEQTTLIPSNKTQVYLKSSCAFICMLHVSAPPQAIIRHVNIKQSQRKMTMKLLWRILDFKLSPRSNNDELSSGYFPGVWVVKTDVSEHCIGSIFSRCCSHCSTCWTWNGYSIPKRRSLTLRRRGNTQKTIHHYYYTAKA